MKKPKKREEPVVPINLNAQLSDIPIDVGIHPTQVWLNNLREYYAYRVRLELAHRRGTRGKNAR